MTTQALEVANVISTGGVALSRRKVPVASEAYPTVVLDAIHATMQQGLCFSNQRTTLAW
jgi:hypothetical protein